jgi:hypothetical protein
MFLVYIIEKLLFIENTHAVRMLGFELLLFFLEVIGTPDKFKLALLTASVNFSAFVHDFHNRDVKFPHPMVSLQYFISFANRSCYFVMMKKSVAKFYEFSNIYNSESAQLKRAIDVLGRNRFCRPKGTGPMVLHLRILLNLGGIAIALVSVNI